MVDFTPFHAARAKDGCVYNKPRKAYTRTKPIKNGFLKIKTLPREKATIIKLTNFGYSINLLSEVFGRSRSYIHKCVRIAITRGLAHFIDKRKLPSSTRLRCSSIRRKNLTKYLPLWEDFIFGYTINDKGEKIPVDEPP